LKIFIFVATARIFLLGFKAKHYCITFDFAAKTKITQDDSCAPKSFWFLIVCQSFNIIKSSDFIWIFKIILEMHGYIK